MIEAELLPKQIEYIQSTNRYTLYNGGWGAGKTIGNAHKAFYLANKHPGINILICAETSGGLRDTIFREVKNIWPPIFIQNIREHPNIDIECINGSIVFFRAFDKEWKAKGYTVGAILLEELTSVKEQTFIQLRGRLRQAKMPCVFGANTNPDKPQHWVYKSFYDPETRISDDIKLINTITTDNIYLPQEYLDDLKRLEATNPNIYRRNVLGEWGDFDDDSIGAFPKIPEFTSEYLVAFLDTSFSDSSVSDRTALTICGFTPNIMEPSTNWPIEFTGKSWQKSITHPDVILDIIRFLDIHKPIEVCVESQLGDSTQIFIDRFKQAELDLQVEPKNHWTVLHQTRNKHERIMLHVAGNKNRLKVLDSTDATFLNPIISYTKQADHDDEIDSLAGAIHLWQTSPNLKNYVYAAEQLRKVRA